MSRFGLFAAAALVAVLGRSCASKPAHAPVTAPPEPSAPTAPGPEPAQAAADLFGSAVRPVLANRCAPCHEPGGVMYEKLPFDSAGVVASHREGVLKRIKAPDEREAIERWLATVASGAAAGSGS